MNLLKNHIDNNNKKLYNYQFYAELAMKAETEVGK